MIPEKRTVTIIGGPGYEYFNAFDGKNTPPVIRGRADPPREPGAWRMELSPSIPAADDVFLNAIQIADGALRQPSEMRRLADDGRRFVGVWFGRNR